VVNKKKKTTQMNQGTQDNIFLIFRVFTHTEGSTRNKIEKFFLNRHEKIAKSIKKKNELIFKKLYNISPNNDRRSFSHIEIIGNTKKWMGIVNSTTNKDGVFIKEKLNYYGQACVNYPQVIMIKIESDKHKLIEKFFNKHIGDQFDSTRLSLNLFFKHYMPIKKLQTFH
jgi:hypothetical protein